MVHTISVEGRSGLAQALHVFVITSQFADVNVSLACVKLDQQLTPEMQEYSLDHI
jgi:hypothetical protein